MKQWRDSPDLPPVSKALLNGLARVPYGLVSPFFMGSPEGARQVAEVWDRLRPVKYTPEEQQLGETMEEIVSFAGEVATTAGAGSLVKAETAGVRVAMRAGARKAATEVGRQVAFDAVEQGALGTAESLIPEASQLGGSRVSQFLARLNPGNYRLCGVNCGVGGIEFRPPRVATSAANVEVAGAVETDVATVAEHDAPAIRPGQSPTESAGRKPTIQDNAAQGAAYESKVGGELAATDSQVSPQVTLETGSGTRVRMDFLSRNSQTGEVNLTEAKSSATAPLTKNQSKAFPEIEQEGARVVGKGKDGYPAGTVLPPSKVRIVRP